MTKPGSDGPALYVVNRTLVSVIAVPFVLYAYLGLIGAIGRRHRGPRAAGAVLFLIFVGVFWAGAVFLDQGGQRWALLVAGFGGRYGSADYEATKCLKRIWHLTKKFKK